MPVATDKIERERHAFAEGGDLDVSRGRLGAILDHVYEAPNGRRCRGDFDAIVAEAAPGARILEVGCGTGGNCLRMLRLGAREVVGVDLSPDLLAKAQSVAGPSISFFEHDLHQPLGGVFDVVVGRAVLHHVDYQSVLPRLYSDNLSPGGVMAFIEPLGEGLVSRLYWKLGSRFHTPDERPFYRSDLRWLRQRFPGFEFRPYGYTSFPIAAVSASLFKKANNPLTRFTDHVDTWLTSRAPWLGPNFRSAIFVIRKPA